MNLSLRMRVLLLVFAINALVFGAGVFFVYRVQVSEKERDARERAADLVYTLRVAIRPSAEVQVVNVLQWPHWSFLVDAYLVRRVERRPRGALEPRGLALNPVGCARRSPDLDVQAVLGAMLEAIETNGPVEGIENGRVLPVAWDKDTRGAVWYLPDVTVERLPIVVRFLPWFVVSTLLLTGGTFLALRRLVLDPIDVLADGARRVRSGDFGVRLPEPARRDEMAHLVRSFNEMTATVRGFNQRLEAEVTQATDQARRAEAAAMTQRRLAAMGELAAGIAHEINNPLGGLQNAVETLKRDDLSRERKETYLGLLFRGLERIGSTVSRLRRFTPRSAIEPTSVNLGAVLTDGLELVRHRADRLGVHSQREGETEVFVRGERNELGQAVLNLLTNALDALEEAGSTDPAGPRIDVTLRKRVSGGVPEVHLTVRDNGHGVSEEELQRVPDLFYTTKDVGKGTGLGLALVHNTLAASGGRVRLASELGSYFEVELVFPEELQP